MIGSQRFFGQHEPTDLRIPPLTDYHSPIGIAVKPIIFGQTRDPHLPLGWQKLIVPLEFYIFYQDIMELRYIMSNAPCMEYLPTFTPVHGPVL